MNYRNRQLNKIRKTTYEQNKKFHKEIKAVKNKETNPRAKKYNDCIEEFNRQPQKQS